VGLPTGWFKRSWPPLLAGVAVVVAYLATLWGTPPTHIEHGTALNAVFDARWLVAAARLLVAVTIAYLLASIVVRVHRGQWVRNAGPLQTDAATQAITEDREALVTELADAKATIDDLRAKLTRSLLAREELVDSIERRADEAPDTGK
jgi:uncharacterized membrane protein YraQ (UPF0718 family)